LSWPPSSAWSRSRAYRAGLCFMRPKMGANRPASRCHFRHLRHNTDRPDVLGADQPQPVEPFGGIERARSPRHRARTMRERRQRRQLTPAWS
jgi:hypothetical protein